MAAATLGLPFRSDAEGVGEFEAVVHASGSRGPAHGVSDRAFEARIVEMSWFGDREVSLPLGEAFHSRRLSIHSSQVGAVAAPRRAGHTGGGWSWRCGCSPTIASTR